MLRGVSPAGIGPIDDVQTYAKQAAAHGYEAIDTDGASLQNWVDKDGLISVQEQLAQLNLVIGSIGLPLEWRIDDSSFQTGIATLAAHAQTSSALGGRVCCTYILPSTDLHAAHFMSLAIRRLRICADILDAYGMQLGLEFVGPHHLRTKWKNPFIWTCEETLAMIAAIGRPNVGLLLDVYHWYTSEMTMEQLAQLKPQQITHVHLNDAPNVPLAEVLDNDRLYPGEGVIDITGFLKTLKQIGYTGPVTQEVLTLQPQTDLPTVLWRRSQTAYNNVFQAAELQQH